VNYVSRPRVSERYPCIFSTVRSAGFIQSIGSRHSSLHNLRSTRQADDRKHTLLQCYSF